MQPALHENPGAAQIYRLLNLVQNRLDRQDVAFLVPHRAVKRAEAAILGTKVRVIDVAVDDIADHTVRMKLTTHRVGFFADRKQIVASKQIDGLATRDHKSDPSLRPVRETLSAPLSLRPQSRTGYAHADSAAPVLSKYLWRHARHRQSRRFEKRRIHTNRG